jgi:hypothetical protein
MGRTTTKLTAKEVEHITTLGLHWVDDELYLWL